MPLSLSLSLSLLFCPSLPTVAADESESMTMALSKRTRTKVYSGKSVGMKCIININDEKMFYLDTYMQTFQVSLICA